MGTSLFGLKPKNTYQGLLKTTDNAVIGATSKFVSDGLGNDSALSLSTSAISVGGLINATGFGQKIRAIGAGDASIGIYRNQASSFHAKLEFMKSSGTYDVPLTVNANDQIGNIGFYGYDGTAYRQSAAINATAVSTSATYVEGTMKLSVWNNTGSNFDKIGVYKEGVYIGNTVPVPTAQLQIRGNGATSATTSLLVQNSAGTAALTVFDNLNSNFGGAATFENFVSLFYGRMDIGVNNIISTNDGVNRVGFGSGNGIRVGSIQALSVSTNTTIVWLGRSNLQSQTHTSGNVNSVNVDMNFNPTSGNGTVNLLNVIPIINQTGGANGITRGVYVNPTITAAADFRAIETSNGGAYINTTSVDSSSILQADSTTKGFLPPRMTDAQARAIVTPTNGLIVYNTTIAHLCCYQGGAWVRINHSPM